jgi:hypothetical protein
VGGDRGGGARPPPKTFSRWLRVALLANGVDPILPLGDALDVAEMLVATGRAVAPAHWVECLVRKARDARAANLPHNRL